MVKSFRNATIAQVKGDHLIVESLRDELVVYDRRTNKAHLLDVQAATIWNAAENGCSMEELARVVDGKTAEQRHAAAQLGVWDLERAGLVVTDMEALPRRGLLKTLGTAAAMPLVISILAPTTAAAQTFCGTAPVGTVNHGGLATGDCGSNCTNGPVLVQNCAAIGGTRANGCLSLGSVWNCCSGMENGTICT